MYCKKCGVNIHEGNKFCPGCGSPVEDVRPDDPFTVNNVTDNFKTASEKISKKVVEEGKKHVVSDIATKESIFSFAGAIRKFAIYSMIAFFLPTLTVSCYGTELKLSNYEALVGKVAGESIGSPNMSVLLLFAVPLLIFSIHVFKKAKRLLGKNLDVCTLALATVEFLLWIVYIGKISSYGAYRGYESVVQVKTTLWYWINMIGICLSILMSAFVVTNRATFETPAIRFIPIVATFVKEKRQKSKERKNR